MSTLKELFGAEVLSEEVTSQLQEAWDSKVQQLHEEVEANLREEFSQRYEHDKGLIVDAADKLISEAIQREIAEFAQDKRDVVESKVAYKKQIREHAAMLNKFVMEQMATEIKELREDRNSQHASFEKLEEFALRKLSSELKELKEDEDKLVQARVNLVTEGKKVIAEAKAKFIKEAAAKAEKLLTETLRGEITQLREDIQASRENAFGRKIMESFAAEFMASGFADGTQVKKLADQIDSLSTRLSESTKLAESKDVQLATAQKKIRIAEDAVKRQAIMQELVAPLGKEKRGIMEDLLKTTSTEALRESYNKYLPAVLNETVSAQKAKTVIAESAAFQKTEMTGNKTSSEASAGADILSLRKLAGIGKI
jgi:hypothetical protein